MCGLVMENINNKAEEHANQNGGQSAGISSFDSDSSSGEGQSCVHSTDPLSSSVCEDAIDTLRTPGWVRLEKGIYKTKALKTREMHTERREKELSDISTGCEMVEINFVTSPQWLKIAGPLAKCTIWDIDRHSEIYTNMFNSTGTSQWYNILHSHVHKMSEEKNDVGIVSLVTGYFYSISTSKQGIRHLKIRHLKKLLKSVRSYDMKKNYVFTVFIYKIVFLLYLSENKPGKSHSLMLTIPELIHNHQPSVWTAEIYAIQAFMYEILAHMTPSVRKTYRSMALRAYTTAREQYVYDMQGGGDNYLHPIEYTFSMVYIMLNLPPQVTMFTLSQFRDSHTDISRNELYQAQSLIDWVIRHIASLNIMKRYVAERISFTSILLYIRHAQLSVQSQDLRQADRYTQQALDGWEDWCKEYQYVVNSVLNDIPLLKSDMRDIITEISDDLTMKFAARCDSDRSDPQWQRNQQRLHSSSASLSSEQDTTEGIQDPFVGLRLEDERTCYRPGKDIIDTWSDVND